MDYKTKLKEIFDKVIPVTYKIQDLKEEFDKLALSRMEFHLKSSFSYKHTSDTPSESMIKHLHERCKEINNLSKEIEPVVAIFINNKELFERLVAIHVMFENMEELLTEAIKIGNSDSSIEEKLKHLKKIADKQRAAFEGKDDEDEEEDDEDCCDGESCDKN